MASCTAREDTSRVDSTCTPRVDTPDSDLVDPTCRRGKRVRTGCWTSPPWINSGEFPEMGEDGAPLAGGGGRGGEREGEGGRRGGACCLVTVTDDGLLTVYIYRYICLCVE